MKAKLVRTGKPMPVNAPQFFFAQDRQLAEEAVPRFGCSDCSCPSHLFRFASDPSRCGPLFEAVLDLRTRLPELEP